MTNRIPAARSAPVSGPPARTAPLSCRARGSSGASSTSPTLVPSFQITGRASSRDQGSKTTSPWFQYGARYVSQGSSSTRPWYGLVSIIRAAASQPAGYVAGFSRPAAPQARPGSSSTGARTARTPSASPGRSDRAGGPGLDGASGPAG